MKGRIFWLFGGRGEKQLATETKIEMSHTTTVARLSYVTTESHYDCGTIESQLSHITIVAQLSPECGTIGSTNIRLVPAFPTMTDLGATKPFAAT
jgi:hypothetical protein